MPPDTWATYNHTCTHLHLEIARLAPDSLIRFDFLSTGWGCSITPAGDLYFPDTDTAEVYGEGDHPQAAMEAALVQLQLLDLVG